MMPVLVLTTAPGWAPPMVSTRWMASALSVVMVPLLVMEAPSSAVCKTTAAPVPVFSMMPVLVMPAVVP